MGFMAKQLKKEIRGDYAIYKIGFYKDDVSLGDETFQVSLDMDNQDIIFALKQQMRDALKKFRRRNKFPTPDPTLLPDMDDVIDQTEV